MASTHAYPQDTVFYTIVNDSIELFQINTNVDTQELSHATIDEDLVHGAIIEYGKIPDKLEATDAKIGEKEPPISPRLESALLDFIRSRLIERYGGDLNTAQYYYNRWRFQLQKKSGGKLKASKPRRVMPHPIVRI